MHSNQHGYQFFDTIIGNSTTEAADQILVAKVARLTNDGREVGPGSYDPRYVENKVVKGSPNMGIDKTKRSDHFSNNSKLQIGPGSYNIKPEIDRKIKT